MKLVYILLVLLGAIALLASAFGIVDFASSSLVIVIGKGRYSSSRKKPLGYPVLKGPYGHQVSLIYSVSVLVKLGLKHCSASFFYVHMWPRAILGLSFSL